MKKVVISGTGLFTPAQSISNDELVEAFNAWSQQFNAEHAAEIASGAIEAKPESSSAFIEKASGIKSRFVYLPDENHWVLKNQNAYVWQKEFFRWLEETL